MVKLPVLLLNLLCHRYQTSVPQNRQLSRLVAMPAIPILLVPRSIESPDRSSNLTRKTSDLCSSLAALRALPSLSHQLGHSSSPQKFFSTASRAAQSLPLPYFSPLLLPPLLVAFFTHARPSSLSLSFVVFPSLPTLFLFDPPLLSSFRSMLALFFWFSPLPPL